MSYEKQTWVTGETITAEKLNHMEDGITSNIGGLVLHYDTEEGCYDKTYNQVKQALENGIIPIIVHGDEIGEVQLLTKLWTPFGVSGGNLDGSIHVNLQASSGDDYLQTFYDPG